MSDGTLCLNADDIFEVLDTPITHYSLHYSADPNDPTATDPNDPYLKGISIKTTKTIKHFGIDITEFDEHLDYLAVTGSIKGF